MRASSHGCGTRRRRLPRLSARIIWPFDHTPTPGCEGRRIEEPSNVEGKQRVRPVWRCCRPFNELASLQASRVTVHGEAQLSTALAHCLLECASAGPVSPARLGTIPSHHRTLSISVHSARMCPEKSKAPSPNTQIPLLRASPANFYSLSGAKLGPTGTRATDLLLAADLVTSNKVGHYCHSP